MQGCKAVYIQSDEASFLLTDFDKLTTEAWFDYNQSKVESISAAIMAVSFNAWWPKGIPRPRPAIFDWLQAQGRVGDDEMHRVFNCGLGMVLVVAPADVAATIESLNASGEQAFDVGEIAVRPDGAANAVVV